MINMSIVLKRALAATAIGLFSATSHAVVITSEDFEGGALGWSQNTSTTGNSTFTRFLGRFGGTGGAETVFKTYALSGVQTQVTIDFDFYEIDSWDEEEFRVFVDGMAVERDRYSWRRDDGIYHGLPKLFPADDGHTDYGFGNFPDQGIAYQLVIATTASSLRLGFGSTLNQDITDEAWGIDNIQIVDDSPVSPAVPEPTTLALIGLGLAGLGLRRRKINAER